MGAGAPRSAAAPAAAGWFQAAADGDADKLAALASESRTWLDSQDSRGMTALMIAAANGHGGCVQLLIQAGCELDAIDRIGWTAAMHAAYAGQEECLRRLIEGGAYLDAQDFLGTTATMRAAIGGSDACVLLLRDSGANVLLRDNLGYDAATHARRKGFLSCAGLLDAGGSPRPGRPTCPPHLGRSRSGSGSHCSASGYRGPAREAGRLEQGFAVA